MINISNKIKKNIVLSTIKWMGLASFLILLVSINYMFFHDNVYINIMMVCIISLIIAYITFTTEIGRSVLLFGKETYHELQKIVWPTYQDSCTTTLVVIIVTMIISLILWGLDTILVHLVAFGLRI